MLLHECSAALPLAEEGDPLDGPTVWIVSVACPQGTLLTASCVVLVFGPLFSVSPRQVTMVTIYSVDACIYH